MRQNSASLSRSFLGELLSLGLKYSRRQKPMGYNESMNTAHVEQSGSGIKSWWAIIDGHPAVMVGHVNDCGTLRGVGSEQEAIERGIQYWMNDEELKQSGYMGFRILRLTPRYAKRVRGMMRQYRPFGLRRLPDTVKYVEYLLNRQEYTDRLVRRLTAIGAVAEATDEYLAS